MDVSLSKILDRFLECNAIKLEFLHHCATACTHGLCNTLIILESCMTLERKEKRSIFQCPGERCVGGWSTGTVGSHRPWTGTVGPSTPQPPSVGPK